jgi:phenylacetate-coenzyme A ligase PaaK-like adenylate-forming protein
MACSIFELGRLLRNRYLPPEELRQLQDSKLRAVIGHAFESVPYYRTLFRSAGLTPQDVRTLDDLKSVPITSKEALRAAGVEAALTGGQTIHPLWLAQVAGVRLTRNEAQTGVGTAA